MSQEYQDYCNANFGPDDITQPPTTRRRRRVPECTYCDSVMESGAPMHDASERCESGKRPHCTCDTCF